MSWQPEQHRLSKVQNRRLRDRMTKLISTTKCPWISIRSRMRCESHYVSCLVDLFVDKALG